MCVGPIVSGEPISDSLSHFLALFREIWSFQKRGTEESQLSYGLQLLPNQSQKCDNRIESSYCSHPERLDNGG
jgi:hypothetical protein